MLAPDVTATRRTAEEPLMTLVRDLETPMVDELWGIRGDAVEVPWPVAARRRVR